MVLGFAEQNSLKKRKHKHNNAFVRQVGLRDKFILC